MRHEATPTKWRPSPTRVALDYRKCSSLGTEFSAEFTHTDYISHQALRAANGGCCFGKSQPSCSSEFHRTFVLFKHISLFFLKSTCVSNDTENLKTSHKLLYFVFGCFFFYTRCCLGYQLSVDTNFHTSFRYYYFNYFYYYFD